jgi:predicted PurR-regulated permease PerM
MDILSFILGMSIVAVIAVAVVTVMAFVKVSRTNKEINNLQLNIDELHRVIEHEIEIQNRERDTIVNDINRTIETHLDKLESERDTIVNDIYRTIDSRLDKLESKFSKKDKIYESLNN